MLLDRLDRCKPPPRSAALRGASARTPESPRLPPRCFEPHMDYNLHMRIRSIRSFLPATVLSLASCAFLLGQPAAGPGPAGRGQGGGRGPARPVLSVTSSSFTDGGEVPVKNSFYGENKSPEFTFNWTLANAPVATPDTVQSYAVI